MTRPNFFCSIEALQWLLEHEPKSEQDDIDLTVDLIEAPYLFIYTSDVEAWELKVMMRGELYDHKSGSGVEKGSLRVVKETGQGSGTVSEEMLRDNMGAFFEACRRLSRFIRDEQLEPMYDGLDPEEAGILLELDGDRLSARKVAGKERPELMCSTLFGGTVMCRPYMEDFMERSALDMMDEAALIEAAEGGDTNAMERLAQLYLNGDDDVAQDFEKSAHWWEKLAETDNSVAQFNMGLYYAKGCGVKRDFTEAAEWMRLAAENGDEDAPALVKLYSKLADALPQAEQGDAKSQAEVAGGFMALGGSLDPFGPGEDYEESLKWARKAVDAGCAAGFWTLALAYEHGRGVAEDHAKATELFRKGAELGDPNCQHSYGCRFANGDGVEQDWEQAFELFRKSAAQGYGLAMRDLGRCYQFGNGCMGNMATALEWYEKADAVLDDPELHQRVIAFRSLANIDPGWGEDYPGSADDDRYWAAQAAKQRAENRKGFFEKHESLIVRNADLTIRDRLFVESGVSARDDWEEIERRLTEAGGVLRSGVSGKTDYLVCDPDFSGDSKLRAAREQQMKGKKVQVVLVADLLRALGMEPDPEPEEQDEPSDSGAEKPSVEEAYAVVLGDESDAQEAEPDPDAAFPQAEPGEDQHPHFDFLSRTGNVVGLFGGIVNQTGTEYAFQSLREFNGYEEPIRSIIDRAAALDRGSFAPAERAKTMAEVFRVELDAFDPGEDREQQILNGMLRRCTMYHDLRSFAWTLTAYCRAQNLAVKNVNVQTLRALARFVQEREHMNYLSDSYCPALCSGPDLHVFFLPEAISDADRNTILEIMNKDAEGVGLVAVASLEELRAELTELWPAMEKIHDALLATRDRRRELSGAMADVLFAWCSMTYAARDPIFTEDGPINNFFEHPDGQNAWMEQWKREREEYERKAAEEWLKAHEKDLSRGATITFSGKKFVFDGSPDGDKWLEILEKLTEKGGIHRTGVSGQTDYLVCDPRRAGDSKIRGIKEQRAKGRCKNTKIVLAEDFYRALGYDPNPAESDPEPAPTPEKATAPAAPDVSAFDPALKLTFENGVRRGDGHYTIGIPDGFSLNENAEGRAFIAYSPDGEDEFDGRVTLFDGERNEIDADMRSKLSPRTLCSLFEGAAYNETLAQMFEEVGSLSLPEGCPIGFASYGIDTNMHCYHCNVVLILGNARKQLRLQIGDVYHEDIPACETMVRDWLRTIQTDETSWRIPQTDDPEFGGVLTNQLAERWAEVQSASLGALIGEYNAARDTRVQKYRTLSAKGRDSVEALKRDLQTMLEHTGRQFRDHFDRALTVLERFAADEKNLPLLSPMLASVEQELPESDRLSLRMDDEEIEAFIPDLQRMKDRLKALQDQSSKQQKSAAPAAPAAPNPKLASEAEAFLQTKKRELDAVKRDWNRDTKDVRETVVKLVKEGIRPELSSNRSGNSIGVTLNFNADTSKAEAYVKEVQKKIDAIKRRIDKAIRVFDEKLTDLKNRGAMPDVMEQMISGLKQWAMLERTLSVDLGEDRKKGHPQLSAQSKAIVKKWTSGSDPKSVENSVRSAPTMTKREREKAEKEERWRMQKEKWEQQKKKNEIEKQQMIADREAEEARERKALDAFRPELLRLRAERAGDLDRLRRALGYVVIRSDGQVCAETAIGEGEFGQYRFREWRDIKEFSLGEKHSVGLRKDGTVVAVGDNHYGQCNVSEWRNVVEISAGCEHTIGLRADGTVVCAGTKHSEIERWKDMKAVASIGRVAIGLRKDGTVVTVGYRTMKEGIPETAEWTDVASIVVIEKYLYGLRNDGTVVSNDQYAKELSSWTDVVKIARSRSPYAVLRADGTVRCSIYPDLNWRNIIDIDADWDGIIGLRADGTAVYQNVKQYRIPPEVSPMVDTVATWTDLISVAILRTKNNRSVPVGMKSDGTIVCAKKSLKENDIWLVPPTGPSANPEPQKPDPKPEQKKNDAPVTRSESVPTQTEQKTQAASKKTPKSLGSLFLVIGAIIMAICIIGACQPYRDTSGWLAPMMVGVVLFSLGYVMVKGDKGKK